jgi:hypothetical protein
VYTSCEAALGISIDLPRSFGVSTNRFNFCFSQTQLKPREDRLPWSRGMVESGFLFRKNGERKDLIEERGVVFRSSAMGVFVQEVESCCPHRARHANRSLSS